MTAMLKPGIQRWLEQHCESSAQVAGGVVVAAGALVGESHTVAEWPAGGRLTPPLAAAAQAALQRARPVVLAPTLSVAESRHNRVISLPLRSGDLLLGAVALAVQADESDAVEALVRELTLASAGLGASLVPAAAAAPVGRDDRRTPPSQTTRINPLQTLLLAAPTLAEGALALLTEMAPMLGCERASLALVDGRELALLAISNSAEFKPEQGLLRQLVAAMQEALDQECPVVCPSAAGEPLRITLAHAELHAATGHAIGSWPLWRARLNGEPAEPVGVLLVERQGGAPLDAEQQSVCAAVAAMLGPLVDLRQRAELPWRRRAAAACRTALARLVRRDDPWPKLAGALALGLLATAFAWPLPYRIGAPVRVEGAVQRVVAAPIDGFLGKSQVRPGDSVHAGDLLIELADADLLLEQRKLENALGQHDNGVAAALARADRAQFIVSQGKAGEARAQLDLVRQQLARTKLLAPMDGIVLKGDLSQTLGAPVQRGDALLTIAPLQQFRLIINVDERDIAGVRAGQTGQLALAAMPVDTLGFTVQRVTPVAVQRDGRNGFEVEARLSTPVTSLRPGLEGVARIDAGRQPLAWQWGHRSVDWLRMAWWSTGI